MSFNIQDVATRRYIYAVAAASVPLLLLLKIITPDYVDVILNWLSAVLGLGAPALAFTNTPKPTDAKHRAE